jgi:hypothetical protein
MRFKIIPYIIKHVQNTFFNPFGSRFLFGIILMSMKFKSGRRVIAAGLLSVVLPLAFSTLALRAVDFNPPCSTILALNPQQWAELFTSKVDNASELGFDFAAVRWADCKSAANQASLALRPKSKVRLNKISTFESRFISLETDLARLQVGGGTMFRHQRARFLPNLELHLHDLIVITATKAGALQTPNISARYQKAKVAVLARLKKVQTPNPFVGGASAAEVLQRKSEWVSAAKLYRESYDAIMAIVGTTVNQASMIEMEFLAKGLWAAEF